MSRLFGILIGVALILSLAAGGAAHAAEQFCLPGLEATAGGHAEGDGDQAPHEDSGVAHHHGGCHGHHTVAPFDEPAVSIAVSIPVDVVEFKTAPAAPAPPHAELRPPIA